MGSVCPGLPEQPHGLRPDAVTGEERASGGAADPGTVEDGVTILGVDHAQRISIPSSDCIATREVIVTALLLVHRIPRSMSWPVRAKRLHAMTSSAGRHAFS